jgi:hypothetical protein
LLAGATPALLAACGGGGDEREIEITNQFAWEVALLNFVGDEASISVSSEGSTYFSAVPYASAATLTLLEETLTLPGTDLLVTGPAGRRSEFFDVEVGPAIFMLSLYAAGAGSTRMRLSVVGGLGNPFDPLGVGNRPFSRLLNIHPQAPAIEVLTATRGSICPRARSAAFASCCAKRGAAPRCSTAANATRRAAPCCCWRQRLRDQAASRFGRRSLRCM